MTQTSLPDWVLFTQALGPTLGAFSTVMVAAIVAFISWRQWRTAKDKLALDLFEKRFEVYVLAISTWQQAQRAEDGLEFGRVNFEVGRQVRFLFGQAASDAYYQMVKETLATKAIEHAPTSKDFFRLVHGKLMVPGRY